MTNYRRRKRPQKVAPTFHRTNRQIRYNEVRVIDENGLVGVMTSGQAIAMAEERNVDLVELNPKATPPVVKLMDYNKFKYQLSKTDGKPKVLKDKTILPCSFFPVKRLCLRAVWTSLVLLRGSGRLKREKGTCNTHTYTGRNL